MSSIHERIQKAKKAIEKAKEKQTRVKLEKEQLLKKVKEEFDIDVPFSKLGKELSKLLISTAKTREKLEDKLEKELEALENELGI